MIIAALSIVAASCCGSNESTVAEARALSQARLAQLVRDVRALEKDAYFEGRDIPAGFRDLKPRSIITRGAGVFLHLSGCMDDKVALVVRPTEVTLTPGETKGRVVLYRSVAGAP